MCSSNCESFLRRVSTRRYALAVGQIRIGIVILPPSKVLALRAVVEVCTSKLALLEEEDGKVIAAPSTRVRVGTARRSCWGEQWIREPSSHAPLLCLSVLAMNLGRHFAAGRVASFAEGQI